MNEKALTVLNKIFIEKKAAALRASLIFINNEIRFNIYFPVSIKSVIQTNQLTLSG